MRILLDGMGGDHAPMENVKGAIEAIEAREGFDITILGDEEAISAELAKYDYDESRIHVVHTTEVIENTDSPVRAVMKKKDSSMVRALNMLKNGEGDVLVSAGSTGAYMAGATLLLGRIPGIDRAAITSIYPIIGGEPSIIVDAGANSECKPRNLLDFAIMGKIYMEKVIGRENPTVGLVNIGAEEGKGNTLTKAAYALLKDADLNFVGNVEGRDVPEGACDVVVCDGFTGNVMLKLTEGFALHLLQALKQKFTDGMKAKLGALMLVDKIKELKHEFDYEEYGGAPILGVNGHVVKTHGSSKANGIKNAILVADVFAAQNVVGQITEAMEALDEVE